jgi:hypothetical protein
MLRRGNLVKSYAKKAQRSILSFCSTKRFSSSSSFVPVQVESFPDLIHQGKVRVQVADDTITRVQVIPILDAQAFGLKAFTKPTTTLDISSLFHITKDYNENQELSTLRIVKIDHPNLVDEDGAPNQIIDLQLYLPHLMDLNISIIRGEVYVKDKIEGNVNVAVGEGEIHANKIRYVNGFHDIVTC